MKFILGNTLAQKQKQLRMQLIVFIDDILILQDLAWDNVMGLVYLLENLGFVISKPKCILEPPQSIEFLGFTVNSVKNNS